MENPFIMTKVRCKNVIRLIVSDVLYSFIGVYMLQYIICKNGKAKILTLKVPITTAADDKISKKNFLHLFVENKAPIICHLIS